MSDRCPLILYATETGNARDLADRIARQCRRISCQFRVLSMDEYSLVRCFKPKNVEKKLLTNMTVGTRVRGPGHLRGLHDRFWYRTSIHDCIVEDASPL